MARIAHMVYLLILAASIVFAAGYGSYMRTAHALADAGHETLVICGSEGVEVITLDASGKPVDPADRQGCTHCADCSLTPLAALPTLASDTRAPMATRPDYPQLAMSHPRAERIWLPSRGPPHQTEV